MSRPSPPDPVSLLVLAHVVDTGSFSAAAARVGLTKSATSKRIAALESALGAKLLRRTTRKVVPTAEGLAVYEGARHVASAMTLAEQALDRATSVDAGTVRLSAPVTFAQMYLASALAGFLEAHPRIHVDLVTDDRFVDVVTGGFDLVIRIGRLPEGAYSVRRLASTPLVVCGSPEYLRRRGVPRGPKDLAEHACLRYSLLSAGNEWSFRGVAAPVSGGLSVSDGTVLREAAKAGIGLVRLPAFMVARELASGELVTVLDDHRPRDFGIHAVHADGAALAPRVRALVEHLAATFEHPPWAPAEARRRGGRSR
ncbi:MAG: LysR family transcriptional regulator [Deltaproteobacteria bacterium]|nr:LysR family transcriptional regulator [Deltaproteobacteria bacterium]